MTAALPASAAGLAQAAGWALAHSVWQAGLIALLVWALLRILPVRAARERYLAVTAALAAVGLLWALTASAMAADWREHFGCWKRAETAPALAPPECASHGVAVAAEAARAKSWRPRSLLSRAVFWPKRLVSGPAVKRAVRWSTTGIGVLGLIWLLSLAGLAARLAVDLAAVRRLRRAAAPVRDPRALRILGELSAELRLRRPVRLLESPAVASPGMLGWRRPAVLLPPGLTALLTTVELRHLLAHELAHVRGRDYAAGLVQAFAEALLFLNPILRRIARWSRSEMESARDWSAVAVSGSPAAYARTLLRLSGVRAATAARVPIVGLLSEGGGLASRIRRLKDGAAGVAAPRRVWRAAGAAVAACFVSLVVLPLALSAARVSSWAVMAEDLEARERRSAAASTPDDFLVTEPTLPPDGSEIAFAGGVWPALDVYVLLVAGDAEPTSDAPVFRRGVKRL